MPGYSGTPLPKKLGIGAGSRVCLILPPDDFINQHLSEAATGAEIAPVGSGPFDVILLFCRDTQTLKTHFLSLTSSLKPSGGIWICWPKKASGIVTDLTENQIRDICLASKLVDNKVCAVTEIWSGRRFVVRVEHRPSWPTG